ncbi:MAG: energy-coupling factor transporter transmembrane protein EcfT [Oscillospiraceae bacterium]|jgi:energy-coupling factor transport system permease protein|nr:energy-coupling factor transporter transmembrane protein EcfT [Oscillospiraceae bacterium]
MLKDITLGQYFPGKTVVHRLDPRTKLVLMIAYITALFIAKGLFAYLFMFAVLLTCLTISKIKPKAILRGLRPVFIIIIFTVVLNIFFIRGETILFKYGIIEITAEGVITAVFMASRLMMLIVSTFLLTYTTSPIALTNGLEKMLNPLKKIKLPVHEFAMMMSIALRFIPTLIEETDKIISAQKSRGADFETGGLIKRAKSVLPIIVPLFISAFRRADELATAMESRCYHGGEGRTSMKVLRLSPIDYIALLFGAAIVASVILLGIYTN